MPVSQSKLARLTPNLGILWISVCSFRPCESIVANPIIYRLVPSPSRYEIRQLQWIPLAFWKQWLRWFPCPSFLKQKSELTAYCCVFLFFRPSTGGKHLMCFRMKMPFSSSPALWVDGASALILVKSFNWIVNNDLRPDHKSKVRADNEPTVPTNSINQSKREGR